MKYQVPQFIKTEPKLVGPLTLKQFLWVAGGVSFAILEFIFLSGYVFIGALLLTSAFFGSLAFLTIQGMPFVNFLAYLLGYSLNSKQYLFKRSEDKTTVKLPDFTGGQG